jgi:hypothetical protein
MVKESAEEVEQMLAAGTWLKSGRIAKLVGRDRTTIWARLKQDDMRFRLTPGGQKEFHPEDVRRLVDELREVHGGTAAGRHAAE